MSLPSGLLNYARWLRDKTDLKRKEWRWAYINYLDANDKQALRRYVRKTLEGKYV